MAALTILAIVAGSAIGIKVAIAWRKAGRFLDRKDGQGTVRRIPAQRRGHR